jgi:hypothetical protein
MRPRRYRRCSMPRNDPTAATTERPSPALDQLTDMRLASAHTNTIIARVPSATAIKFHGTPETRGRAGSCKIVRAIRDGEGAFPAASSSVNGAAARSSARPCWTVGADLRFSGRFRRIVMLRREQSDRTEERSISRFVHQSPAF